MKSVVLQLLLPMPVNFVVLDDKMCAIKIINVNCKNVFCWP